MGQNLFCFLDIVLELCPYATKFKVDFKADLKLRSALNAKYQFSRMQTNFLSQIFKFKGHLLKSTLNRYATKF